IARELPVKECALRDDILGMVVIVIAARGIKIFGRAAECVDAWRIGAIVQWFCRFDRVRNHRYLVRRNTAPSYLPFAMALSSALTRRATSPRHDCAFARKYSTTDTALSAP